MLVVLILAGILCGCQLSDKGTKAAVINTRDVLTKCNDGLRAVEEVQRQFADRQAQLKAQEEAMSHHDLSIFRPLEYLSPQSWRQQMGIVE